MTPVDPYYVYRPLLDLIGKSEGTDKGRGYNETLAYGRLTGGPVEGGLRPIPTIEDMLAELPTINWPEA